MVKILIFLKLFFKFSFSIVQLPKKRKLDEDFEEHQLNKNIKIADEFKEAKFGDLLEKPLGSVPSIIFWSDQQVELINNITNMKHTLLMGDYGTGEH